MKTILMTALVINCSGAAQQMIEQDTETDSVVIVEDYPDGPYGYKAAVREIDGELTIDDGDTFPDICLETEGGEEYCADDFFGLNTYWVIIVSVPNCNACDELELRHDKLTGLIVNHLKILPLNEEDGSTIQKLHGIPNEFMIDTWLEVYSPRGYPATFVIDLTTMEIAVEVTGFADTPKFWGGFADKLDFWRNEIEEVCHESR